MASREQIMQALFALAQTVTWTDPNTGEQMTFQKTSRRLLSFGDAQVYPTLCQIEGDEVIAQRSGLPHRVTITAAWVIFHNDGLDRTLPNVPAATNNAILDAVLSVLAPAGADIPNNRNTLGGLAYRVWVEGKVLKDPGDLDGQGILVVPVKVLLP